MEKYLYKINKKFLKVFISFLSKKLETMYLGSNYGGWNFVQPLKNEKLIVLSAGVGEDISFDIDFLNTFKSEIYFIDPTPRALAHLNKVINCLGNKATAPLLKDSGNQKIESYDLEKLDRKKIHIINKALYDSKKKDIKFYPPKNQEHVSHSISNFKNNYSDSDPYILVESITIKDIIQQYSIDHIDIIKLDIEGAETRVVPDMLKKNIFPDQILVEFDELNIESSKALIKILLVIFKLTLKGYKCIDINNYPNFLFLRKDYFQDLKDL